MLTFLLSANFCRYSFSSVFRSLYSKMKGGAELPVFMYIKHGHCQLIYGESVFFATYWAGDSSGESNM